MGEPTFSLGGSKPLARDDALLLFHLLGEWLMATEPTANPCGRDVPDDQCCGGSCAS